MDSQNDMHEQILVNLLAFYGLFLISCGIISVLFIGLKAKTALISGGISGSISLLIAYLIFQEVSMGRTAGIFLTFVLLVVFSWRATMSFFRLFEMIPEKHPDVKGKGIAFLIISLMAVVSLIALLLQVIFYS